MKQKLLLVVSLLAGAVAVQAQTFSDGTLLYSPQSDGTTCYVSGYSSPMTVTTLTVPSTVSNAGKTYSVSGVALNAFQDCTQLTSIDLSATSVTTIGTQAFSGCSSLSEITLPETLVTIRSNSFTNCTALTSITLPGSVNMVEASAFQGCSSLAEVTFASGDGQLTIYNCFAGCPIEALTFGRHLNPSSSAQPFKGLESLTTVTLEAPASAIPGSFFQNCVNLQTLSLPEGLISIGTAAFENCSKLTELTIPGTVTSISGDAFAGCSGVTSLTLASGTDDFSPALESDVFSEMPLTSLTLGRDLDNALFSGKYELTDLTILDGVTAIANGLFEGCSSLTQVTIPGTVTTYGRGAFADCPGITEVTFESGTDPITMQDVPAFAQSTELTKLTFSRNMATSATPFKGRSITTLVLGAPLSSIPTGAFQNCRQLTSVTLPETLVSVGNTAFASCTALDSITIPASVTSIGSNAFASSGLTSVVMADAEPGAPAITCPSSAFPKKLTSVHLGRSLVSGTFANQSKLTRLTIGEGVGTIASSAFQNCTSLPEALTIPANVTEIGDYAFGGCDQIADLILADGTEPLSIGSDEAFPAGITSVYVGRNLLASPFAYNDMLSSVEFGSVVTDIPEDMFNGCTGITSVSLPAQVESIGSNAFYGCEGLSEISIPGTVTSLGETVFGYCSALTSVTIEAGSGILASGTQAFEGSPIHTVVLGRDMSNHPFMGHDITSLTILDGVTSIAASAFEGCTGITEATLPASVTTVGSKAFSGCTGLPTDLVIAGTVNSLGAGAYKDCTQITSLHVEAASTPLTLGEGVFANDPIAEAVISRDIQGAPFKASTTLQSLTLSEGITSIGADAFNGCSALASVSLPSTLLTIGNNAFASTALTSVVIPASVTNMGLQTFRNSKITTVTLEDGTGTLASGNGIFEGCDLATVHVGRNMSGYPFANHTTLTDLTIGNQVTAIADNAFEGCTGLTAMPTLSKALKTIGVSAFNGCTGITGPLTIDITVDSIGSTAFANTGITDVTIKYIQNVLECGTDVFTNSPITTATINRKVNGTPFAGLTTLTDVTFGQYVNKVDDGFFRNCISLNDVELPVSLSAIGNYAFQGCSKISTVNLPKNCRTIGNNAYQGCTALSSVTLGYWATEIGFGAFADCTSLANLPAGSSLKYIGERAFQNCISLPEAITIANGIKTIGANAFQGCPQISEVTLADGNGTTDFSGNVFPDAKITTLSVNHNFSGANAFANNPDLTTLTFNTRINTIPEGAFTNCTGIPSLTVPGTYLYNIGANAFQGCTGIRSITLPEQTHAIGDYAFQGCTGFTRLHIPSFCRTIGNYAFQGCTSVNDMLNSNLSEIGGDNTETVVIGYYIESIGDYAFAGINPEMPTIEANVEDAEGNPLLHKYNGQSGVLFMDDLQNLTHIGDGAFQDWTNIRHLVYPQSMTDIVYSTEASPMSRAAAAGVSAFDGCTNIETLELPTALRSIADGYFLSQEKLTEVASLNPAPPTIGDNTFAQAAYDNATVDVANSDAANLYKAARGWENFQQWNEDGTVTGITDTMAPGQGISVEATAEGVNVNGLTAGRLVEAYTTAGQLVASATAGADSLSLQLAPAIYIIRVDGITVAKIAVK